MNIVDYYLISIPIVWVAGTLFFLYIRKSIGADNRQGTKAAITLIAILGVLWPVLILTAFVISLGEILGF